MGFDTDTNQSELTVLLNWFFCQHPLQPKVCVVANPVMKPPADDQQEDKPEEMEVEPSPGIIEPVA